MAARQKKPKATPFLIPRPATLADISGTQAHEILVAASLAARILSASKMSTLDEAIDNPDDVSVDVRITPAQAELIDKHSQVLRYMYIKKRGEEVETRHLAVCPECTQWLLVAAPSSAPSKCNLTSGCTGSPMKASSAVSSKAPTPHNIES